MNFNFFNYCKLRVSKSTSNVMTSNCLIQSNVEIVWIALNDLWCWQAWSSQFWSYLKSGGMLSIVCLHFLICCSYAKYSVFFKSEFYILLTLWFLYIFFVLCKLTIYIFQIYAPIIINILENRTTISRWFQFYSMKFLLGASSYMEGEWPVKKINSVLGLYFTYN